MKRSSGKRPQASIKPGRRSCASHSLDALSKRHLLALISELQAENKSSNINCIENSAAHDAPIEVIGPAAAPVPTPAQVSSLFIDQPVRSGQNIEFPAGDVTIVGSVSSGAEILAGGSIHIYGALRGRALAGIGGDCTARIFCRSFHAELLAINGRYRVADNVDPKLRGRPVQARLEGLGMTLTPLD